MRILITGAAGGIGSTLGFQLLKRDYELILVDNLRNGYEKNLERDGKKCGELHKMDINSDDFNNLVKRTSPHIIVHLAAITSLPDCEVNKAECLRSNVEGTVAVLETARKNGVKRVIFSSTSAVYEKTELSFSGYQEDSIISPFLFYSMSKKMAEDVCISYRENYDMDVVTLRLFNVFGPNQDIHRPSPPLINYLFKEFSHNRSPVLHSDGNQVRDYVHIDDVVEAVVKCIEIESIPSPVYNIASGTLTSVKEIVNYVKDEMVITIDPIYRDSSMLWDHYSELFTGSKPLKKTTVSSEAEKKSLGNIDLAEKELNWAPSKTVKDSILATVRDMINGNS